MKSVALICFVNLFAPLVISAQNSTYPTGAQSSTYIHCSKFFVSGPLRDLPDYMPQASGQAHEAADRKGKSIHQNSSMPPAANDFSDPIRQTSIDAPMGFDDPIVDFPGTSDVNDFPGDPNGAVDSTYYVQAINVSYTVFDKVGNIIMPAKDIGALWGLTSAEDDGDPVVLYDKFADRWLISEFQVQNIPNQLCVAVSKTNDPAGAYYVWEFSLGNTFPDYPKYSIWNDGYYVTFQGSNANTLDPNIPQQVAVLERNRMLNGSPSAGMILANIPTPPNFQGGNNSLWTAPKTLDCDASALPPYGTPDYLVFFENIASGGASNSIVMDSLIVDTTLHTFRIAKADSFAVPTFNAFFSNGHEDDISQPGDPNGVDALDGTFNFRVPYMKCSGYNSIVLSNTVNLGSKVAGIRWYELRQPTAGTWSVYQEGTFGPADGTSRWNGAICEDYDGNIGLEYSVSSGTIYPSIWYTGRLAGDPLGQMTFAEENAISGNGSLTAASRRWGDYSQLDIDPSDGLTFWGINQYVDASSSTVQRNRIFSFKLEGNVSGIAKIENQTTLKVYQNGNLLDVTATGLPSNDLLVVDLFDISGRQLAIQQVTPSSNRFEIQINVSALPKGIYFVRMGKENFQRVVKTEIN